MIEITNQINTFGNMIQRLEAWDLVIDGLDEKQVFTLSLEHIEPLANLALSATQAIRGQMIYAVVEGGALANGIIGKPQGWNGVEKVNMKVAKSVAGSWRSWPALAARLTTLEAKELNEASGQFRSNFQHGAPGQLIIGLTSHTEWLKNMDGTSGWAMGKKEPITLWEIIPHLKNAHAYLLEALEALKDLAIEWENSALSPPS